MNGQTTILTFLQSHVPFAALLVRGEVAERPLLTRVVEGALIAAVAGGASAYIALTNFQAATSVQLEDLKAEVAQQHRDTMQEIQQLQYELNDQRSYQGSYNVQRGPGPHGS